MSFLRNYLRLGYIHAVYCIASYEKLMQACGRGNTITFLPIARTKCACHLIEYILLFVAIFAFTLKEIFCVFPRQARVISNSLLAELKKKVKTFYL